MTPTVVFDLRLIIERVYGIKGSIDAKGNGSDPGNQRSNQSLPWVDSI